MIASPIRGSSLMRSPWVLSLELGDDGVQRRECLAGQHEGMRPALAVVAELTNPAAHRRDQRDAAFALGAGERVDRTLVPGVEVADLFGGEDQCVDHYRRPGSENGAARSTLA